MTGKQNDRNTERQKDTMVEYKKLQLQMSERQEKNRQLEDKTFSKI